MQRPDLIRVEGPVGPSKPEWKKTIVILVLAFTVISISILKFLN